MAIIRRPESRPSGRLEFERAAVLRDQINSLRSGDFKKAAKMAVTREERGARRNGKGASRRR